VVIVTTNLPFSEWTTVIPNARLCKALIDRITDRANIVETGTESYRFRRTLKNARPKVWKLRASTAPPLARGGKIET
jgi:DNA replication protein DnaC